MKKLLTVLAALGCAATLVGCGGQSSAKKTIAVVQFGTHTSLDEINTAIVDRLTSQGYSGKNYEISQYNAQFSGDTASQIMSTLKNKADVVVAIATPVAQAAYNTLTDSTPIVFAAVSDPIGAGLVTDPNHPTENITGTSDEIQVNLIIDKALEVNPDLKSIGYIYTASEINSVTNLGKIQSYCDTKGIKVEAKAISVAGEMSEIASTLVRKVDAMLITDDNTVASSVDVLAEICKGAQKPLYTGVESEVRDGGMLCVGINYTNLGIETANMVIDILNNKKISDIPVKVFKDNLHTYLNTDYVDEIKITIPDSILNDENLIKVTDTNK